jgi:hypothetical protein
MVVHICNPSFSGDGDQEDYISRSAWVKSYEDHSLTNKPGVVMYVCNPSYVRGIGRRTAV